MFWAFIDKLKHVGVQKGRTEEICKITNTFTHQCTYLFIFLEQHQFGLTILILNNVLIK